jgi:hypothetical protein
MKFNPYPVLLTTGVLMLAIVVFAQAGPTVSVLKAKIAAVDAPSTDEARHPDTRLASATGEPAEHDGGGRTLRD